MRALIIFLVALSLAGFIPVKNQGHTPNNKLDRRIPGLKRMVMMHSIMEKKD